MSFAPLVSLGARFDASDAKATNRPSPVIDGFWFGKKGEDSTPYVATEIRIVMFETVSRRKMSSALFVSPSTRSGVFDSKTTHRQSREICGRVEDWEASPPRVVTEHRFVVPSSTSRT